MKSPKWPFVGSHPGGIRNGTIPGPRLVALRLLLVAVLVTCHGGCQIFQRFRHNAPDAPVAFGHMPTQAELLANLQAQSSRIQQLRTDVGLSMDGMAKLSGHLSVQRPDRLRLKAGLAGISEMGVDIGSNEEVFWIWTRVALPGETPAIYYARHEDYQTSELRQVVPLEPSWLLDALGLIEFRPGDRHEGPFRRSDGRYVLRTYHQTRGGPQTRVSIVDAQHGWINQQSIYDAKGQLVAYVNSIQHRYYPEYQVSLPQRIELHVVRPDGGETKVVIDAGKYKVNTLYGDPDKLWSMPTPPDVPKIDLTRLSVAPAGSAANSSSTPTATSFGAAAHQRRLSHWYNGSNSATEGLVR